MVGPVSGAQETNSIDGSRMNKNSAKELIETELRKENPDWKLVESLSSDEVSQDPSNVRFSVDAGHIQRLGVELVGKKDTTLSELIKNAFDADATEVDLDFQDSKSVGGTLTISDNGTGMTLDVIRDSWMRISTDTKAEQPLSPLYDGRRAGRKGIGRFAVQRLAKKLELRTRPAGEPIAAATTACSPVVLASATSTRSAACSVPCRQRRPKRWTPNRSPRSPSGSLAPIAAKLCGSSRPSGEPSRTG